MRSFQIFTRLVVGSTIMKSTVDWCEQNFEKSDNIAEFYNTASSLSLLFAGTLGYIKYRHVSGSCVFLWLAVIGIGSVLFHALLTVTTQMTDEIPMVFFVVQLLLNVTNVHQTLPIWSIAAHSVASVFASYIFYQALNEKHDEESLTPTASLRSTEFLIFQSFILSLALCIAATMYNRLINENRNAEKVRIAKRGSCIFIVGYFCWLADYFLCPQFAQLGGNPQFHAWWHIFASIGLYDIAWVSISLQ